MSEVLVKLKVLRPTVGEAHNVCPEYQTPGAAGADLRAAILEPLSLEPGARQLVPTGIAIELPEAFEAQVRPRSGLAMRHGVTTLNSPGTIDSDYRGEIGVILVNLGHERFLVEPGARIAQLVIAPVTRARFEHTIELSQSRRDDGGFGHTGNV